MPDRYWFRTDSIAWPVFAADWPLPSFTLTLGQPLLSGWEWQQATGASVAVP